MNQASFRYDPNRPYRYVRYGRMSTDRQNERSPDQQFAVIEQTLQRQGHPWVHVRDVRDSAISGRLINKRPGFAQLLRKIRDGLLDIDLILVDTLERLGRAEEMAGIRQDLHLNHGVLVLTADSNFTDPTSVSGKALALFEGFRASEENRVKAHNVRRGLRDKIAQGQWPGGPPPLGYRLRSVLADTADRVAVDHTRLEPDPKTAWVIPHIFDLAQRTGWGMVRLARAVNTDPAIPEAIKPISTTGIKHILGNPIYIGQLRWGQHSLSIINDTYVKRPNDPAEVLHVEDYCEPLVDRAVWDAVQALRAARQAARPQQPAKRGGKQLAPVTPGRPVTYPLSGLVRCGACGGTMRTRTNSLRAPDGNRYVYYACDRAKQGGCANRHSVREQHLRAAVIGRLRQRLFPPPTAAEGLPNWYNELVAAIRQELNKRAAATAAGSLAALRQEQKTLEQHCAGWAQSLGNPQLSPAGRADLERRYAEAIQRRQEVETALAEHQRCQEQTEHWLRPAVIRDRLARLDEVLAGDSAMRLHQELAQHINRIDCFPDGRIIMRTTPLGLFGGVASWLRPPRDQTAADADHADAEAPAPNRADLDPTWCWSDPLEWPERSWAAGHYH